MRVLNALFPRYIIEPAFESSLRKGRFVIGEFVSKFKKIGIYIFKLGARTAIEQVQVRDRSEEETNINETDDQEEGKQIQQKPFGKTKHRKRENNASSYSQHPIHM